jgi:recombination protein RecA
MDEDQIEEILLEDSTAVKLEVPSSVEVTDQMKALDRAFNKKFGDKYYGVSKDDVKRKGLDLNVEFISTGCYSLDYVLGGGGPNFGIPVGRVLQFYGASSSAKTLISTYIGSTLQKLGKRVAFIDAEHSMDPAFANMCGLNMDDLIMFKPNTCEDALEALREFTKSGVVDLVILDSTASLSPQAVQDKNVGEATMAVAARYWSTLLPELVAHADNNKCTVILLNQVRTNLGTYGSPVGPAGGKALGFYSSIILKLTRSTVIKAKGEEIGIVVNISTTKNKVGTPFKSKEISVLFPHKNKDGEMVAGIDVLSDLLEAALDLEVLSKSGAWLEFEGLRACGKEAMKEALTKRLDIVELLKEKVKNGKA